MPKQEEIREGIRKELGKLYRSRGAAVFPEDITAILTYLKSQGVVIRVEKELPKLKKLEGEATLKEKMAYLSGTEDYRDNLKGTGFCAYEEII